MLTLSRKPGETIVIDGDIEITIVQVKGDTVRIGIDAPKQVGIWRKELLVKIEDSNREAATSPASSDQVDQLSNLMKTKKTLQS